MRGIRTPRWQRAHRLFAPPGRVHARSVLARECGGPRGLHRLPRESKARVLRVSGLRLPARAGAKRGPLSLPKRHYWTAPTAESSLERLQVREGPPVKETSN